MLERMSWQQLVAWREFTSAEPLSEYRHDIRASMICSVVANSQRSSKQRPVPVSQFLKAIDYSGDSEPDKQPLTDPSKWSSIKASMKLAAAASDVATKKRKKA